MKFKEDDSINVSHFSANYRSERVNAIPSFRRQSSKGYENCALPLRLVSIRFQGTTGIPPSRGFSHCLSRSRGTALKKSTRRFLASGNCCSSRDPVPHGSTTIVPYRIVWNRPFESSLSSPDPQRSGNETCRRRTTVTLQRGLKFSSRSTGNVGPATGERGRGRADRCCRQIGSFQRLFRNSAARVP